MNQRNKIRWRAFWWLTYFCILTPIWGPIILLWWLCGVVDRIGQAAYRAQSWLDKAAIWTMGAARLRIKTPGRGTKRKGATE